MPIGNANWYKRNAKRSNFDQQPEDPAAMIAALETAYRLTKQERFRQLANKCFSWFLGNNVLGKSVYNNKSEGCYDGIEPNRRNLNQGAESLVSYLASRLTIGTLNAN